MTDSPHASRHATTETRPFPRAVAWLIGLLVAAHTVLVMLWVAPTNPMRDAVGRERVARHVEPYFEQSWTVFAPTPRRVSESVRIRAVVQDRRTGARRQTAWVDVTAAVARRSVHVIARPRSYEAVRRLGAGLQTSASTLNARQRTLARGDGAATVASLRDQLIAARGGDGADRSEVDRYLVHDRMLTRFASIYAAASSSDEVVEVQYVVGRRRVPSFAERRTSDLEDVAVTSRVFAWRRAAPVGDEERRAFDGFVEEHAR